MLSPDYPIETERLALRPLRPDDAEALHAYQSREDVCRYIPYPPRTLDRVRERLASPDGTRSTLTEPGQALLLAVVRRTDGVLVGDVMLAWTSKEHGTGELGYVFDPRHHGNGYATEIGTAVLRLAFEGLGLHRVIGRLDARNTASARVLERIGMRLEAHLVENEWFKGEWTDELDYAVLDREFAAHQERARHERAPEQDA